MGKFIVVPLLLVLSQVVAGSEIDAMAAQARALSKSYAGQLKQHLQQGMERGGPIVALEVCNVQAPAIAQAVGDGAGWQVGRTSLKARNENNRPDRWELNTLLDFEKRKDAGGDITALEQFAVHETDEGQVFRYMKAIPTGAVCLSCHGDNIPSEVQAKIHELYPADQATGFEFGDIRGAFTLSKKLD